MTSEGPHSSHEIPRTKKKSTDQETSFFPGFVVLIKRKRVVVLERELEVGVGGVSNRGVSSACIYTPSGKGRHLNQFRVHLPAVNVQCIRLDLVVTLLTSGVGCKDGPS